MGSAEIVPAGRPGAFVLRMDGRDQSYVDLDDPTLLAFDYVRRIGDVVDVWGEPGAPARVLHVGGAGMTLPRYVAHTRPRSRQVVLEPDTDLVAEVRRALPLPRRSGITVRPVDGRTGLETLRDEAMDLVVVDAFADGRVPGDLVTREAVAELARVLAEDGMLLLNLVDRAPFPWTRRVVATVREVLGAVMVSAEPATLRARRPGNLLLVAGRTVVPVTELRARSARGAAPYRVLDRAQVSDSLGGGRAFTDADAQSSPRTG